MYGWFLLLHLPLIMDIALLLTFFHIIGVAIGVGGATVSDVLFFRALKDKRISADELGLLHTLGMMLWVGLIILIASGLGFVTLQYMMSGTSSYIVSAWFQAKMTIIAILFTNAFVMHLYVFPFMKKHVGLTLTHAKVSPHFSLLAATGVVSIVSWYSALTLGVTRGLDFTYGMIVNLYLVILVFGILVAYGLMSIAVFPKRTVKTDDNVVTPPRHWPIIAGTVVLGIVLVIVSWYIAKATGTTTHTHSHDDNTSFREARHSDHTH